MVMGAFFAVMVAGSSVVGVALLCWRPHTRPAIVALIIGLLLAFLPAARRPVAAARQHRSVAPPVVNAGPRRMQSVQKGARPAASQPSRVAAVVDRRVELDIVPRRPATFPAAVHAAPIDRYAETDSVLQRAPAAGVLRKGVAGAPTNDGQGPITGTVKVPEGNVRSGPGTTNQIIGMVNQGDELIFEGRSGDWYLVRLSSNVSARSSITGQQGWVSAVLIDALAQQPPLVASAVRTPRWQEALDTDYIYQRDGVINFRVTPEQSGTPISARLDAPAETGPMEEVSFNATLAWSQGHAAGGVILHTLLADGRDLAMRIGPGEGFPWVDFTLDGQELTAQGGAFPLYDPTPIRLAWDGQKLALSVGDRRHIELLADSPVQSIRFAVETDEGCIFHLKVADMRVRYAE
jgi:hypothetical protein